MREIYELRILNQRIRLSELSCTFEKIVLQLIYVLKAF